MRAMPKSVTFTDPFFSTAPDNMRTLLRHWEENYGGVRGYLRSCGVTEECMDTLRARLLG